MNVNTRKKMSAIHSTPSQGEYKIPCSIPITKVKTADIYDHLMARVIELKGLDEKQHPSLRGKAKVIIDEVLQNQHTSLRRWLRKNPNSDQVDTLVNIIAASIVHVGSPWTCSAGTDKFSQFLHEVLFSPHSNLKSILKATNWKIFKSIFIDRDPKDLEVVRNLFQTYLSEIAAQLTQKQSSDPSEIFFWDTLIGNLLSIYIFLAPQQDQTLHVPQRCQDKWVNAEYKIDAFEITPTILGQSPLVAMGLIPVNPVEGTPPLLVFKGTTYPTDDGFLQSLLTDFNPGCSVGSYAFKLGKEKITGWLKENSDRSGCKANVFGQSLGGALSIKSAIHSPEYVGKVITYDPPGITKREEGKWNAKLKNGGVENMPDVAVVCQKGDPIHLLGRGINKDWKYIKVVGDSIKTSRFKAHAGIFAAHRDTVFVRIDRTASRFFTTLHYLFSTPIFSLLFQVLLFGGVLHGLKKIYDTAVNAIKNTARKVLHPR